jgi:hypothetical protein
VSPFEAIVRGSIAGAMIGKSIDEGNIVCR